MFGLRIKRNTQRVFLDYASTTPLDSNVFRAMKPYFSEKFYNASSLYAEGVEMKKTIEAARTKAARSLLTKTDEIYFTGSGTEANNIALLGAFKKHVEKITKPHIIVSAIEHPAILEVAKEIERLGGSVTYLPVDAEGIISEKDLEASLTKDTVLVSIIYVNNEIGVVQPIRSLSRIIKKFKEENKIEHLYFHIDASQAPNYFDCSPNKLGVDMMTLDGHKMYGPKGIGCLYKHSAVELAPIMFGGGQEGGLRSGTLNVPAIIGFAEAFSQACALRDTEYVRVQKLQGYFIARIKQIIPSARINGSESHRVPNNVNVCIPGIDAEFEVIRLDAKGIACAYTTACKTSDDESKSYVVQAVNGRECASSSLRFSFGRFTKKRDIDRALCVIEELDYNNR